MCDLAHRRQFVIGPRVLSQCSSWVQHPLAFGRFVAQLHPDLEFTQTSSKGVELSLLGFILDPLNTTLSDSMTRTA